LRPLYKKGFCRLHFDILNKGEAVEYEGPVRKCPSTTHTTSKSAYPKDKVPEELFIKNDLKRENTLNKYCKDCREYYKEKRLEKIQKFKKEKNENKDPDFDVCQSIIHEHNGVSNFPRNKVPKHMFLYLNDEKLISKECSDCRNHKNMILSQGIKKKKEERTKGNFHCYICGTRDIALRSKHLNGEIDNSTCINCRNERYIKRKEIYKEEKKIKDEIKYEYILEKETCYEICNKVFISETNSKQHTEIKIYLENEIKK